jgi:hypothetical protein
MMNRPIFHKAWQMHRPERTAELLSRRGYYAEVFSGNWAAARGGELPYGALKLDSPDHMHYILTTATAEELAEVRDAVLDEWDEEMGPQGLPSTREASWRRRAPQQVSPGAFAVQQYEKWRSEATS